MVISQQKYVKFWNLGGVTVSAYVIDTMNYSSWEKNNSKITFIKESVENIDKVFQDQKFDFIFCNRVIHHLVTGKSYKSTISVIERCFEKINYCLADNGKLCIYDHFYNGIIWDKFPSFAIYKCTTNKNPLLIKLFRYLGAKSSGSGVCFQSEKMWIALINKFGFAITSFKKGNILKIGKVKKCTLLIKDIILDNVMICEKQ